MKKGYYQFILCPPVVELQPPIGLDNHNAGVEKCQFGRVRPIIPITEAAFKHSRQHPADKRLVSEYPECREALVVCHNFCCQLCVAEAFFQVVIFHLITK